MVPVHCEISAIEGDVVTSSEGIKEIETKISELLNNTRGLPRKQRQSVARKLKELSYECCIDLMAASPTGSIVVYFLCQTFRSIVVLKGMIDSGQMKNILEDIFNCILENDSIRLILEVSLEFEEYQERIQEARTTSETFSINLKTTFNRDVLHSPICFYQVFPYVMFIFLNFSLFCVYFDIAFCFTYA